MKARWFEARGRMVALALSAGLTIGPLTGAQKGGDSTVSGRELARFGFFQDFDELDLEALLETASATVSVATGREASLARAPGAVSVINDTQIRNLGLRTLEDLLRILPGFEVLHDTLGQARIVTRGLGFSDIAGGSAAVLVLLNGQRLDEAVSGAATIVNLELPLEHVRRIEVWRDPASSLYGDGAARAVINLVSHSARDFQGVQLSAAAGSFGAQDYSLRLANIFKGLSFSGLVQWTDTNGAPLFVPEDRQTGRDQGLVGVGIAPVSLAPAEVRDGRQLFQSLYVLGYGGLSLQWRSVRVTSDAYVGFADTLGQGSQLDRRQSSLGLTYKRSLPRGRLELRGAFTRSKDDETLGAAPPGYSVPIEGGLVRYPSGVFVQSEFQTDRYDGEASFEHALGAHKLLGGLALSSEQATGLDLRSNFDYFSGAILPDIESLPGAVQDQARDRFGALLHDSWSRGRLALDIGARLDHVSDAGDHFSPRAAAIFELRRELTARASYARGFRAPSFTELYYSYPGQVGQAALAAPRTEGFEVGLAWRRHDANLVGGLFWNTERDPIRRSQPYDPLVPAPLENGPSLRSRGLELEFDRSFGLENQFFANLAWQQVEQAASGGWQKAEGLPEHLVNVGATVALGRRMVLSPVISYRGARGRSAADDRPEFEPYLLCDVTLKLRNLYRTLEFAFTIRNLLDERYADPAPLFGLRDDYPQPGRRVFVQGSYRF